MLRRDIVHEMRKILERTRDPRGHDFFVEITPNSYEDELLRELGWFYRAQLAVTRDWVQWHAGEVAHEARAAMDSEENPHVRYALHQAVVKHDALADRWQDVEREILADIDNLERPFYHA